MLARSFDGVTLERPLDDPTAVDSAEAMNRSSLLPEPDKDAWEPAGERVVGLTYLTQHNGDGLPIGGRRVQSTENRLRSLSERYVSLAFILFPRRIGAC